MPSNTKQRLQRRLAEKKKAAGISSEEAIAPPNMDFTNFLAKAGVPSCAMDVADGNCWPSLVEELNSTQFEQLLMNDPRLSLLLPRGPEWSPHRLLSAFSLSTDRQARRIWRELVEEYDLKAYYLLKRGEVETKVRSVVTSNNRPSGSWSDFAHQTIALIAFRKLPVGDRLLAAVFAQLDTRLFFRRCSLPSLAFCRPKHVESHS